MADVNALFECVCVGLAAGFRVQTTMVPTMACSASDRHTADAGTLRYGKDGSVSFLATDPYWFIAGLHLGLSSCR